MTAHSEALFWRARQSPPPVDLVARYRCSEGDNTEYELSTSGASLPPDEAGLRRSLSPPSPESAATFLRGAGVVCWWALGSALYGGSILAVVYAVFLLAPP